MGQTERCVVEETAGSSPPERTPSPWPPSSGHPLDKSADRTDRGGLEVDAMAAVVVAQHQPPPPPPPPANMGPGTGTVVERRRPLPSHLHSSAAAGWGGEDVCGRTESDRSVGSGGYGPAATHYRGGHAPLPPFHRENSSEPEKGAPSSIK